MDSNGVHLRDRIELTPQLISSFPLNTIRNEQIANEIAPHLFFIGREVIIKGGTTQINDFDVYIIADRLRVENSDSLLLVKRTDIPKDTDIPEDEESGFPGRSVTIYCRHLHGVRVRTEGGQGGSGTPYNVESGEGEGEDGQAAEDCIENQHGAFDCWVEVIKEPGRGDKGRQGSKGGPGGTIRLSYVYDRTNGAFHTGLLEGAGGLGGEGGPGGKGGCMLFFPFVEELPAPPPQRKCDASDRGPQGAQGDRGFTGDATAPQVAPLTEQEYWDEVQSFLGSAKTQAWANHRLLAADYYFRAFNPAKAQRADYLTIALTEAKAVQQLAPGNEQANLYRSYLEKHLNVFGQARDSSIIPDFQADYAQVLSQYDPELRQIFDQPKGLISDELVFEAIAPVLINQVNALNTMLAPEGELQQNKVDAQTRKDEGAKQLQATKDRLSAIRNAIPALEDEIEDNESSGFLGIELTDALQLAGGVALNVLSNVAIPGAGGVIVNQLLPYANALVGNPPALNILNSALDNAGTVINGIEQKVEQGIETGMGLIANGGQGLVNYAQAYLADPQGWEAKLKQEWNGAQKAALDFAKIAQDLSGAQATSSDPDQQQRQQRLISLYQEQASLTQQQFQQQLQIQQAEADLVRATKLIERVTTDRDAAVASVNENTVVQRRLREGVINALRSTQADQGRLLKFFFRAARALQIYTLATAGDQPYLDSTLVPYDYGYLNPDDEVDYLEEVVTDPTQSPAALFRQKLTAATPPFAALAFFEIYDNYRKLGQPDGLRSGYSYPLILQRTEHALLVEEFIKTGELPFTITLPDLARERPGVFEAKITKISLELDGVTAAAPFICKIRHSGKSLQQPFGSGASDPAAYQALDPTFDILPLDRRDPAAPTLYSGETLVTMPGEDQRIVLACWGRGVAADWILAVQRNSAGQLPVNLQNLTQIKLLIYFDAKDADARASIQSIHHATGALRPDATVYARLTMIEAAPSQGTQVKLTTSNGALVKVPGVITVPAGATTALIPIQVEKEAAGATVTLTAKTKYTLKTQLQFPPAAAVGQRTLPLGTKPDFHANVLGIATHENFVYASHYYARIDDGHVSFGKGELVVIERTTFKEVPNARVTLGFQPRSVAINPVTRRIYATNYGKESYSLSVLDATNPAQPTPITELKLGQVPIDVAVNSATNRIYITNPFQKKLHVIDGATHTELAAIKLASRPYGITVDEQRNTLYVALSDRAVTPLFSAVGVIKISGETGGQTAAEITTMPIFENPAQPDPTRPTQPIDVAVNPLTNHLYVANLGGGNIAPCVTVLNLTTGAVNTVKSIAGVRAIAVNPQLNQIYLGTDRGVQIMDGVSHTMVSLIPQKAPWGVAVNPTTGHLYAGNVAEGTITQIATPDISVLTQWV